MKGNQPFSSAYILSSLPLLPYPAPSILAFSELPHYDVTMKKKQERESGEASRSGPIKALKSEVGASIYFQCSKSFVHRTGVRAK